MSNHSKTKKCISCKEEKRLKEYLPERNKCKKCTNEYNLKRYHKNKPKIERLMPFDWIWEREKTIFESQKKKRL